MQNLQTFNFQSNTVRIEIKNNEPLFCLTDVASALEIKNANPSRFNLKTDGIHKMYSVDSLNRKNELMFISEQNLYRVIFRSNKPEAVKFQDWVFDEVLPSIRKTGSYSLTITTQQQHAIREAVNQNVGRTGRTFQAVYRDLYNRFQIPKYQDLPAKDFQAAIEYLGFIQIENKTKEFYVPDDVLANVYRVLMWSQRMRLMYEHLYAPMKTLGSPYAAEIYDYGHELDNTFNMCQRSFVPLFDQMKDPAAIKTARHCLQRMM